MIEKKLYIYYFVLLLILCSWISTVSTPPIIVKISYLFALFVPALIKKISLLIPILICFLSISVYAFSHSFMPTEIYYYVYLLMLFLFFKRKSFEKMQSPPLILIIFGLYVICVDYILGGSFVNIDYSLLVIILAFFFISQSGDEQELYVLSFLFITIILSIYFFIYRDNAKIETSIDGRIYWVDPNYLGNLCAMGVVLAYNKLINHTYSTKLVGKICFLTVVLGSLMLVLNASRGAFLSASVPIMLITFFSDIKFSKKIGIVGCVIIGIFIMYALGSFDLLLERSLGGDDDTGNGRTIIWEVKMFAFMHKSFLEHLFGLGYLGGFYLAIPGGYGFHNDYLAFLVDYGFIGITLFFCTLIYPLVVVWKHAGNRILVISLVLFLAICCTTLEPLTAGRSSFWFFYLTIVLFARWSKYCKN
jgi:hypothetical protein